MNMRRTWQSIDVAAARLGRHRGHLRKLCKRWEREGKARLVKGGGTRSHWQIRTDAELAAPVSPTAARGDAPAVLLTIGRTTIEIDGPCTIRVGGAAAKSSSGPDAPAAVSGRRGRQRSTPPRDVPKGRRGKRSTAP